MLRGLVLFDIPAGVAFHSVFFPGTLAPCNSKIHDMMRPYGSVLMTLERFNLGKAEGVGCANAICIASNLAPPIESNSVRNLILI